MRHLVATLAAALTLPGGMVRAQGFSLVETNFVLRMMAANTTSGNSQSYEAPGIRIFQALKPDVVAVQEFKFGGSSTPASLRQLVDTAFGTNFSFYCEPSGSIPNGVISRWPIVASGSWDDPEVNDRGFAWARIDLPGTNDLFVVSVHLYNSGSSADRNAEALALKGYISTNFPAGAWTILGGDLNTTSRGEAALGTLKTFLSDEPVPADQQGNPNTNEPRSRPYDYVLPSFSLTNFHTPLTLGARSFSQGLVFDSEVYTPLTEAAPVQAGDSHVANMQHMAVLKAFRLPCRFTNLVASPPLLAITRDGVLRWTGLSNTVYEVQSSHDLADPHWVAVGSALSATTSLSFTNPPGGGRAFYRVMVPAR